MVKTQKLYVFIAILFICLMYTCEPKLPTGSNPKKQNKIVLNSMFVSTKTEQWIYINKTRYYSSEDSRRIFNYDSLTVKFISDNVKKQAHVKKDEDDFNHSSHYIANYTPTPKEKYALIASHPNYDTAKTSVQVPDSVEIISPSKADTIDQIPNELKIDWSNTDYTYGYYTEVFLIGYNNNLGRESIQLNNNYYPNFLPTPEAEKKSEYTINGEKLEYCFKNTKQTDEMNRKLSKFNTAYLILRVYSLSKGAFYMIGKKGNPDEISGFNSHRQSYSNIKNGKGIAGAAYATDSPPIYLSDSLINNLYKE